MSQPDRPPTTPGETALARRQPAPLADAGGFDAFQGDAVDPAPPNKRFRISPWRLLRFKWTMLLVFVVAATAALAGVWRFATPQYQAIAVIEVQPSRPRITFDSESFGGLNYYQQFLGTQVRKLTSAAVVEAVLSREDVLATSPFTQPAFALPGVLGEIIKPKSAGRRILDALEIYADGTTLINVAVTLPDPDAAAIIANAFVDEYLKSTQAASESADLQLLEKRRQTLAKVRVELEEEQKRADEYRKMLQISSPDQLLDQQRMTLQELISRRDKLQLDLSTARRMLTRVEKLEAEARARGGPAADAVKYSDDPGWRQLSDALASVEFEIQTSSYGPAHPEMVKLTKQADFLRSRLEQRQLELDAQPRLPAVAAAGAGDASVRMSPEALRFEIEQLETRLEVLNPRIEEMNKTFQEQFDLAAALTISMRKIDGLQEQYQGVKQLVEQQEIERFAPAFIRWDTVAKRPYAVYADPRKKLALGVLFAALVAACGAGLARAYFSGALFEVERLDDLSTGDCGPLLGPMPIVPQGGKATADEFSLQGESIRMVRTALLQRLTGSSGHIVQVTSAGPGAGKTTFAIMLARSLAQIGKRVLLVDADLRNPSVARTLGIAETDQAFLLALTEADASGPPLPRAVRTQVPKLDLLLMAQPADPQQAEILATDAPRLCLTHWRTLYDIVLLDCSPVLPVADARILARHSDGSIFVVREDHCHRKDVFDALAYLRAAGGQLLGTVFNGGARTISYRGAYQYARAYASFGAAQSPMDVRVIDPE